MSSLSVLCDRLKVYHRPEYIREKWSSRFEILDILDGYAEHQALVVCKKI